MNQTPLQRAETWLPGMIRLTAAGHLLFLVPELIPATTHHLNTLSPFFARLFDWGEGGPQRIAGVLALGSLTTVPLAACRPPVRRAAKT
jgi:hypothetical protein